MGNPAPPNWDYFRYCRHLVRSIGGKAAVTILPSRYEMGSSGHSVGSELVGNEPGGPLKAEINSLKRLQVICVLLTPFLHRGHRPLKAEIAGLNRARATQTGQPWHVYIRIPPILVGPWNLRWTRSVGQDRGGIKRESRYSCQ